jgi:OFA family oxalate/formate antiporter-like MFS transporter
MAAPLRASSFNRWFIPVGAVAVHICIGSVYAWSTFNRPIIALFPQDPSWFRPPYTTFTTALVLLGLSAAFGGPWVERRGPRAAATAAALFFALGLLIGGIGLALKHSILVFFGMGVVGGVGCGLGYIAPVSTLVKWFRTALEWPRAWPWDSAVGVLAGYPNIFRQPSRSREDCNAVGRRLLRHYDDWRLYFRAAGGLARPNGSVLQSNPMITDYSVTRSTRPNAAVLLDVGVLFINVTAGTAFWPKPLRRRTFSARLRSKPRLSSRSSACSTPAATVLASASDYIGRQNTYIIFFLVQFAVFLLIPHPLPRRLAAF